MVEIQYGGVMICSGIEGWKGGGGVGKKKLVKNHIMRAMIVKTVSV